jgi:WD40 repeat protein
MLTDLLPDGDSPLFVFKGHISSVACVAFNPSDTMIASGSFDKSIKLWDVASRSCISTFTGHDRYLTSICFGADGRLVYSSSADKSIRVWNLERLQLPPAPSTEDTEYEAKPATQTLTAADIVFGTADRVTTLIPFPAAFVLM